MEALNLFTNNHTDSTTLCLLENKLWTILFNFITNTENTEKSKQRSTATTNLIGHKKLIKWINK